MAETEKKKDQPLWQRALNAVLNVARPGKNQKQVSEDYRRQTLQNMIPKLTPEQAQQQAIRQAREVYGPAVVRDMARANEGIVFPSTSTLPGYPKVFMPGADNPNLPGGFTGTPTDPMGVPLPGAAPTKFRTPAVSAPIPPEVGSAQWDKERMYFLESQYDFKKRRGEQLPPKDDYIMQGLRGAYLAKKSKNRLKQTEDAQPAGTVEESQSRVKALPYNRAKK